MRARIFTAIIVSIAFSCLSAEAARPPLQPILLQVDESDPSHVVITSTLLAPSTLDDTTSIQFNGIDLQNFFTDTAVFSGEAGGDLTPNGESTGAYTNTQSDDSSNSGIFADLNFYAFSGATQEFDSGASAFTGSVILDLSSVSSLFSTTGGYIISGDATGEGVIIGQWELVSVPESSSYGILAFLGLAGMIGYRRLSFSRRG